MRCVNNATIWEGSSLSFNEDEGATDRIEELERRLIAAQEGATRMANQYQHRRQHDNIESEEAVLLARRMTEMNEELNYVVHGAHESREGSTPELKDSWQRIEHIADQMNHQVQNWQLENQQIVAESRREREIEQFCLTRNWNNMVFMEQVVEFLRRCARSRRRELS